MQPELTRRDDGFLERGHQVTRLEAFVDAAFAFAVTLLVVSFDAIPASIDELLQAMKGAPAFALSVAQIALFWRAHVTWTRRYGLDDTLTLVLSLILVFLALIYVYPLKVMLSTFFGWITGGWLPSSFTIRSASDLLLMFTIYGVAFATLAAVMAGFYLHAWRRRAALALSLEEQVATRQEISAWLLAVGVGLVSIAVSLLLPTDVQRSLRSELMMGLPGMAYGLMALTGPVTGWYGRRERARLEALGESHPRHPDSTSHGMGTRRRRRRRPRASA